MLFQAFFFFLELTLSIYITSREKYMGKALTQGERKVSVRNNREALLSAGGRQGGGLLCVITKVSY